MRGVCALWRGFCGGVGGEGERVVDWEDAGGDQEEE